MISNMPGTVPALAASNHLWHELVAVALEAGLVATHDAGATARDLQSAYLALCAYSGQCPTKPVVPIGDFVPTTINPAQVGETLRIVGALAYDAPGFDGTPAARLVDLITAYFDCPASQAPNPPRSNSMDRDMS